MYRLQFANGNGLQTLNSKFACGNKPFKATDGHLIQATCNFAESVAPSGRMSSSSMKLIDAISPASADTCPLRERVIKPQTSIPQQPASTPPSAEPNFQPPAEHACETPQTSLCRPHRPPAPLSPTTPTPRRSTQSKSHLLPSRFTEPVSFGICTSISAIVANLPPVTMTQKWNLLPLRIHLSHPGVASSRPRLTTSTKICRILKTWPNTAFQLPWASHTSPSAALASTTCAT
jgi:hypothetical protein